MEISATTMNLFVRGISKCLVPDWVSHSIKSSRHMWVSSMMEEEGTVRNKLPPLVFTVAVQV